MRAIYILHDKIVTEEKKLTAILSKRHLTLKWRERIIMSSSLRYPQVTILRG